MNEWCNVFKADNIHTYQKSFFKSLLISSVRCSLLFFYISYINLCVVQNCRSKLKIRFMKATFKYDRCRKNKVSCSSLSHIPDFPLTIKENKSNFLSRSRHMCTHTSIKTRLLVGRLPSPGDTEEKEDGFCSSAIRAWL